MSKHKPKTVHRGPSDQDIKRSEMIDANAVVEPRRPAVDTAPNNDWSILFDALDAFEPGFHLVREQPAS